MRAGARRQELPQEAKAPRNSGMSVVKPVPSLESAAGSTVRPFQRIFAGEKNFLRESLFPVGRPLWS